MLAAGSTSSPPPPWAPTYPAGWFTGIAAASGFPEGVVGRMIPQLRAATVNGVIGRLYDVLGNGFVILGDVDPLLCSPPRRRRHGPA